MMLRKCLPGVVAVLFFAGCTEEISPPSDLTDPQAGLESGGDDGKEDNGSDADASLFSWVNTWDRWTTQALDQCGYNDASRVGTFELGEFDAESFMAEIHALDGECEEGRIYSRSQANGIELFLRHIEEDEMTRECMNEQVSSYDADRARTIISDPENLGVFASVFPEGGIDAEYCMYYHFYVFRPDGSLLRWTFNYTD